MGEKQVYEVTCLDGSLARYHVDHDKEEVFLETGKLHPETGEPLLQFSSRNVAPFPKMAPEALEEFADTPIEELIETFGEENDTLFAPPVELPEDTLDPTAPEIVGDLDHVIEEEVSDEE